MPSHSTGWFLWVAYTQICYQQKQPPPHIFSIYVLLLAVNGVLEAFLHATATAGALAASNAALVAFTAGHAVTSLLLARAYGVAGACFVVVFAHNMVSENGLKLLITTYKEDHPT